MHYLESRFPANPELPKDIDGIIVLGGSINSVLSQEWNQLETNHYNERLIYFASLAGDYPEADLIFSGGNASLDRSRTTESAALSSHLKLYNIEMDRVKFENRSRNTYENAVFSAKFITSSGSNKENWVLITTAFHMPRSVGSFCKQGIKVIPYPVDHHTTSGELFPEFQFDFMGNLRILDQAIHEWGGLLAYYITKKTDYLVPLNCNN